MRPLTTWTNISPGPSVVTSRTIKFTDCLKYCTCLKILVHTAQVCDTAGHTLFEFQAWGQFCVLPWQHVASFSLWSSFSSCTISTNTNIYVFVLINTVIAVRFLTLLWSYHLFYCTCMPQTHRLTFMLSAVYSYSCLNTSLMLGYSIYLLVDSVFRVLYYCSRDIYIYAWYWEKLAYIQYCMYCTVLYCTCSS